VKRPKRIGNFQPADLEICDTADFEVCATIENLRHDRRRLVAELFVFIRVHLWLKVLN